MSKIIFVCVVLVWALIGVIGGMKARNNKVNYAMIAFMGAVPFLPLVAHMYGLC